MKPTAPLRARLAALSPYGIWGLVALGLLLAPRLFTQSFALSLLSQMGIMVIFALSYNILFGQTGLLSFGHSVYLGLGAFFCVQVLNAVAAGSSIWPVSLLPLVGGGAGAFFALVFGAVLTRKAGTPFAMITLGIGEMVFAAALMFPGFFGGEAGIVGDRTAGGNFLGVAGWNFGPPIQVYYLIAAWCFVSTAAMFALTRTPLGRVANAVRDNPERAEFIGFNPRLVRWIMVVMAGFFAGVAGALTAINFEIASAENLSALRSGSVLLATVIGGSAFFFGPVLGAVVFVFFAVALSEFTPAWQLYLGLFFVLLVMFAPGGLASLLQGAARLARGGKLRWLVGPLLGLVAAYLLLALGVVLVVEMAYQATLALGANPVARIAGAEFDPSRPGNWALAAILIAAGTAAVARGGRRFAERRDSVGNQAVRLQQPGEQS